MNNIERRVLLYIGENPDSPDVFTDSSIAPIRDSINDAVQEIIMTTGGLRRKYSITLAGDRQFYRLRFPDGYYGWTATAWLTGQTRRLQQSSIIEIASRDPYWQQTTGTPTVYVQVGLESMLFYPKPSGDGNMVELDMVLIPNSYEDDTDRVLLLKDFQRAAEHYAVSEFWAGRGDAVEALSHHQKYLEVIGMKDRHLVALNNTPTLKYKII
jgi:hypothetical protein